MKNCLCALVVSMMLFWVASAATAEESWTPDQQGVLAAIEQLSSATAPDGAGADAYGASLTDDFSRWTVGSSVTNDKQNWVDGIRGWFKDGWRVSDRQTRDLEILVRDDYAFVRRVVEETYVGPEGEQTVSSAALAEVWVRGDDGWRLFLVNVHPMDDS